MSELEAGRQLLRKDDHDTAMDNLHDAGTLTQLASTPTDAQLAVALMAGEPTAARMAVERFTPTVRGILRRGVRSDADVDDAVQDVFFCLFRRVSTLRNPLALRAFVLAIAAHTVRHARRGRSRREWLSYDDDVVAGSSESGGHEPSTRFAFARLKQLLARLDERERCSFLLCVQEGCTAVEVAEALGVSVTTARRALKHARSRIQTWAARDAVLLDYMADGAWPASEELTAARTA